MLIVQELRGRVSELDDSQVKAIQAFLVGQVELGPMLNKEFHGREVALHGRPHERRAPIDRAQVDVCVVLEQQHEDLVVAQERRVTDRVRGSFHELTVHELGAVNQHLLHSPLCVL